MTHPPLSAREKALVLEELLRRRLKGISTWTYWDTAPIAEALRVDKDTIRSVWPLGVDPYSKHPEVVLGNLHAPHDANYRAKLTLRMVSDTAGPTEPVKPFHKGRSSRSSMLRHLLYLYMEVPEYMSPGTATIARLRTVGAQLRIHPERISAQLYSGLGIAVGYRPLEYCWSDDYFRLTISVTLEPPHDQTGQ